MNKLPERFSELELSLTPDLMKPAKIHESEVEKTFSRTRYRR